MSIYDLSLQNEEHRINLLNMVSSENVLSTKVKTVLSLQNARYHADFYAGSSIFRNIYEKTSEIAKTVFNSKNSFITPLSGNMALTASLFAFSSPKDKVAMLPLYPAGGYPFNLAYFKRFRIDIPFSLEKFNIDTEKTRELIEAEQPRLVILGSSFFLFPHPVREISNSVNEYGGTVVYDGSHVLGLIAGREFQDPLGEGADILLGSTHKSFPGPQGGIILSNNYDEEELEKLIGLDSLQGIILVDNIHNSRIAALGVSLEEFQLFGKAYAKQIVKNSKTLANSIQGHEVDLYGKYLDYSNSHQVIMKMDDFSQGEKIRNHLFDHYSIATDAAMRFGTAELTRLGFKEREMEAIGHILGEVIFTYLRKGNIPLNKLKNDVIGFITQAKTAYSKL